jgi:hypothetical protein
MGIVEITIINQPNALYPRHQRPLSGLKRHRRKYTTIEIKNKNQQGLGGASFINLILL